jgi:aerobic-type carbon monoxide dehydrogenase small subunit (CoxS/CutS family)
MRLTVNGHTYDVAAEPSATLLSVLREDLALTGTKLVCDRGECGACTVHLDDPDGRPEPAYACLTLAAACEGRKVTTIEGMGTSDAPHPLQEAFVRHDALQCGFCTPGQIMAAAALLARDPHPTEEVVVRWMSGNLCRCGAYPKIVRAIMDAAGTEARA